jgi:hypothetical protein
MVTTMQQIKFALLYFLFRYKLANIISHQICHGTKGGAIQKLARMLLVCLFMCIICSIIVLHLVF